MSLGFVVNIKTVFNLDIDFGLSRELCDKYLISRAFSTEYYYREGSSFRSGTSHRSRIQGVEITKGRKRPEEIKILNRAFTEIRNRIDRCGGFVKYSISGIDVFGRVIVTLFDPVTEENLNEILLKEEYSTVFKKYNY